MNNRERGTRQSTHWEDCWREHGDCAIAELALQEKLLHDGWKEPQWATARCLVPRRTLQAAARALCNTRGLIQRLESHGACCELDERDHRALRWGYDALVRVRKALSRGTT